jgi:hypothetical protein
MKQRVTPPPGVKGALRRTASALDAQDRGCGANINHPHQAKSAAEKGHFYFGETGDISILV